MSQKYQDDGKVVPVTILEAGPCTITRIRTLEKDGYTALQMAFGTKKNIKKPVLGQVQEFGLRPSVLREFRLDNNDASISKISLGSIIKASVFHPGDKVKITGQSKGKGFQGVLKRHGFHGSPKSHGHKDQLRMPGSIGATNAARVFKGKKMAGRMGGKQVSILNMTIVDVDVEKNLLFIKGAVPGHRGSLVYLEAEGDLMIENNQKKEDSKVIQEAKNDQEKPGK